MPYNRLLLRVELDCSQIARCNVGGGGVLDVSTNNRGIFAIRLLLESTWSINRLKSVLGFNAQTPTEIVLASRQL